MQFNHLEWRSSENPRMTGPKLIQTTDIIT